MTAETQTAIDALNSFNPIEAVESQLSTMDRTLDAIDASVAERELPLLNSGDYQGLTDASKGARAKIQSGLQQLSQQFAAATGDDKRAKMIQSRTAGAHPAAANLDAALAAIQSINITQE